MNEQAFNLARNTTGNDVSIYWVARLMGPLGACVNEKVASVEVLFILDGIFICYRLQLRRKSCRKCQFRERRFKFLASVPKTDREIDLELRLKLTDVDKTSSDGTENKFLCGVHDISYFSDDDIFL